MNIPSTIEQLSNAPGAPGFEDEILSIAKNYLNKGFSFEEDRMRNLYIRSEKADSNGPVIMLDAHSDEVGFMIQSINANGTCQFLGLGGWNPQSLSAHSVKIRNCEGEWIKGIIASKPTHFLSPEEMKKPVSMANLVIDVGATSQVETEKVFGIRVGAPVVPDVEFSMDNRGKLMYGKAFDDRLGCAALLEVMKLAGPKGKNLTGVLSTQEELGLRGVNVAARKAAPDIAICLEGTPADDTFNRPDFIQAGLKKGPQIRHMDRSVLCNPRFVRFAIDIAKDHGIEFQEAVRSGGGNNGSVITLHDRGIPTITLGIPVRYIHSHYSIATVEDFENTVKWCRAIVDALDAQTIESF